MLVSNAFLGDWMAEVLHFTNSKCLDVELEIKSDSPVSLVFKQIFLMSCAGKYRRAITLLTITKAFSSAWHQVWLLCSVFGLIQSCFLGTIVNITMFTIMITSSAVMTIMTRYVQCRRRQMPPWYQHKKLPALIHSSHCSGGGDHYGDEDLLRANLQNRLEFPLEGKAWGRRWQRDGASICKKWVQRKTEEILQK